MHYGRVWSNFVHFRAGSFPHTHRWNQNFRHQMRECREFHHTISGQTFDGQGGFNVVVA